MLKIALRFMVYDKPKTIGALLGVVIANFLIGQQTGIFTFLTGAMSALVDNTQTTVWVVDDKTNNVNALGQFDRRIGSEIESIPGVAKAHPFVIAGGSAKFQNGQTYGVQMIGAQPPLMVGGPWNIVEGKMEDLLFDGAVSTDYFDRKNLGYVKTGEVFEINGKRHYMAIQTKGARGFGAVYVFTTIERARAVGNIPRDKVSAFLLDLKPGANRQTIIQQINGSINGVKAWIPEELSRATITTILSSSGIAISTGTMIIFAVISGMVIVGLTLFSAAVDRIRDYATMKAIGATNTFIAKLIFIQAFIISTIGFGIASGLIELFRNGIAKAGAIFHLQPVVWAIFYSIILVIGFIGSLFAIRRITKAEPASVFKM
jgi:putative ABC transport system permease protein